MKKFVIIILAFVAVACLSSCNKNKNDSVSNFLPGTSWSDGTTTVTFTKSTISANGASASYSVTASVKGVSTFFDIDNLKVGDVIYASGAGYESQDLLVLTRQGGTKLDRFTRK